MCTLIPTVLIAAVLLAAPAAVSALDLPEAARLALEREPRLEAAAAAVAEAEAGRDIAGSGYRPDVGFTASAGVADLDSDEPFPPSGARSPTSAALALSQPLYTFGRTRYAVGAAEAEFAARRAELDGVRQSLLLATARTYLALLRDQAEIELNAGNLELVRTAREHTRLRLEVGQVTATDLAQADARVARAEAELRLARARAAESIAGLERLVGQPPGPLERRWPEPALPGSLLAAAAAVEDHPAVEGGQAVAVAAEARVEARRAAGRPVLTLEGQAGREDESRFTFATVDSWSVSVQLTVPIYQGGRLAAQTRQARSAARRAKAELDDARAAVREDIERAWQSHQAYAPVIAAVQRQIEAAELALSGVEDEVAVGARTTLDLLDAQQELLAAQVALLRARHDQATAALALKRSMGQLSLQDL